MLESCITLEPGVYEFEDNVLFEIDESVWVLGREYDPKTGECKFVVILALTPQIINSCNLVC